MKCVSLLLTCWMTVAVSQFGRTEDYHPSRTLLIDYFPRVSPTNFLFRGNMPVVNGSFAYSEIISNMSTIIAKQHNFSMPKNFTLVVVSYLNPFEERDLIIERDYFKAHPQLGKFYNRIITGTVVKPPENDTSLIKDTVKVYVEESFDKLPKLMDFFRDLLMQNTPVFIYSHCEAGTDRTGEVSGAYYLRYLNMTFSEALSIDNHVQSRDMQILSVLKQTNGFINVLVRDITECPPMVLLLPQVYSELYSLEVSTLKDKVHEHFEHLYF